MKRITLVCLVFGALIAGCVTVEIPPDAFTPVPLELGLREVRPTDDNIQFTLKNSLSLPKLNNPDQVIYFPAVTCVVEGADEDFWYLSSPEPLEYRANIDGEQVTVRKFEGGVIMSRKLLALFLPFAVYEKLEGDQREVVWKFPTNGPAAEGTPSRMLIPED
ncbi:MAG: hypothetical protein Q7P63_06710 [Verrucomicrobiota bacterium JB022]|nr:hypothetical protein [Verrucomicrobiota bacterium JB022]